MVLILDVNDNPPEFTSKYYFATISENVVVDSDVVRVMATSKDTGVNADITYSIIGGNEHRKFRINPKSGVIIADKSLDYERATEYFLTIQAQDGGDPPLSNYATINITVNDINDNKPIFNAPSYAATMKEDARMHEEVVVIDASDLDDGENGRIAYKLIQGDRHNQVALTKTSFR